MQEYIDHSDWYRIISATTMEVNNFFFNKQYQGKLGLYLCVLKEFHLNNADGIQFHISRTKDRNLLILAKLRLAIITKNENFDLETLAPILGNDLFAGEAYFLLARYYSLFNDHESAKENDLCAYSELRELAPRKSIRALLNYVASDAKASPEKSLISDYKNVYHKALELKEIGMAGLALMKVSAEYQKNEEYKQALHFIEQALELMENDKGQIHHYHTMSAKCHLLYITGSQEEADLLFDEVIESPFEELKESIELLSQMRQQNFHDLYDQYLAPRWNARKAELQQEDFSKRVSLTPLEGKLLNLLSDDGAEDISDLVKKIYGKKIDFAIAQNRFRVLLSRLVKKQPGIITREGTHITFNKENLTIKHSAS